MIIARRTMALAWTDAAISALVLVLQMELTLLAIADLASGTNGEPSQFQGSARQVQSRYRNSAVIMDQHCNCNGLPL